MSRHDFALETPLYHVTQVVDDTERARSCYERLFERPIRDGGHVAGRGGALFTRVGETLLEAMIPDQTAPGLEKFVALYGSRWHSVGWYARGIDALADRLRAHEVRFRTIDGAPIERAVPRHGPYRRPDGTSAEPDDWWSAMFVTHLRDTYGIQEFCEPKTKHELSRWRGAEPLRDDPLGIVGPSYLTTVVADREQAARFWVEVLGAQRLADAASAVAGALSAFVRIGESPGTIQELAEPTADGPAQHDLTRTGTAMLHAVTFAVKDLDVARAHLASVGIGIEADDGETLVTLPADTAGARYGFTTAARFAQLAQQ